MALEAVAEAHWVQNISLGAFLFSKGKKIMNLHFLKEKMYKIFNNFFFKISKIIGYFTTLMARASYLVSESDRTLGSQCIHLKTDILSHLLCHRELSKFILEIIRLTWGH